MALNEAETPNASKPAGPFAVETSEDDDAKLPYFNDPRFQEIYRDWVVRGAALNTLSAVFDGLRYRIRDEAILRDVLEDAFALYDVAAGKRAASELLRSIERGATPEVFIAIAVDLSQFLAPTLEKFLSADSAERLTEEQRSNVLDLLLRVRDLAKPEGSDSSGKVN
ncbi:MAG: hypothetical protein WA876_11205 [Candidatus Acidiferrales bacterium]